MKNNYKSHIKKLNSIFEERYKNAFKIIKGKNKQSINNYISDLYRKWYCSSLFDETYLSPANIIAKLKSLYAIDENEFEYIIANTDVNKKNNFVYISKSYSDESFPIIDDLKLLTSQCSPILALDEFGTISQVTKTLINKSILIHDNYYIDYLLDIAYELKICEEAPSIYLRALQKTNLYENFFMQDNKTIFQAIFKASISIFTKFLNSTLPFGEHTDEFVLNLIKNPLSTDEMYKILYSLNGVDLDTILDEENDNVDIPVQFKEYLNLGIYYLGIGIDKYFFTPFGNYLKIIQPNYVIPTTLEEDIAILYNALRDNREIEAEVYAPCSDYHLTKFGMDFLGVNNSPDVIQYMDSITEEKLSTILSTLDHIDFDINPIDGSINDYSAKINVYRLKISLISKKSFWISFEVSENTTLSDLHLQICYTFDLNTDSDYSFFIGMDESPFKQFTPQSNKLRTKKTETITLAELDILKTEYLKYVTDNTSDIFYDVFNDKKVKLEISLQKIKNDEYSLLFPRIYRKSKLFNDFLIKNDLIY